MFLVVWRRVVGFVAWRVVLRGRGCGDRFLVGFVLWQRVWRIEAAGRIRQLGEEKVRKLLEEVCVGWTVLEKVDLPMGMSLLVYLLVYSSISMSKLVS